jgi:predicted house-cleaning NTP pyrophosphatase (Maf/HAM1 superfamily)
MAILSRNPENSAEWIETLFVEETSVTFDTLPGPLIDAYVTSGEPL